MPHDVGSLDAGMIQHGQRVRSQVGQRIGVDSFGRVGCAESAKVGDDGAEPRTRQRRDLVAP